MKYEWISVKERLPRHGQYVIAKYDGVYGPRIVKFGTMA